jgi:glutamyl-tRNA reductase
VSSAAVQLAKQIFGSLAGRRAMVLGAGEMAELALECFAAQGVRTSIVANRTFERAEQLAARYGAVAMHYDECWRALAQIDVMVSSTASPHAIVFAEHIRPALAARGDRPLCILDIALPRDVDPAVGDLDNVFLYNLDDLQAVVSSNLERRRAEVPSAEELISGEVERFWDWLAGLAAVPVLTEMRARMEALRAKELEAALRKLGDLAPAEREAVAEFSRTLMNKFLHDPTVRLRAAAANGRGLGVVDTARYLFGLERPGAGATPAANPEDPSNTE